MNEILDEIARAVAAGFYYVGVALTLTLPDVCAGLESPDGRTTGDRYKAWCRKWIPPGSYFLTEDDLYSMRCGVIHQGQLGIPSRPISRVLFTLRTPAGNVYHNNLMMIGSHTALNLDAVLFCNEMADAVRRWIAAKNNDTIMQTNLPRLLTLHPNGLVPYIIGVPVIA